MNKKENVGDTRGIKEDREKSRNSENTVLIYKIINKREKI